MTGEIVLVVEDNLNLPDSLEKGLQQEGYKVYAVSNGTELLTQLKKGGVDVILLDLGLPDGNGLSLITKIREQTNAPIIVISGKVDVIDKIVGLELGADDYLAKPFKMRELQACIKAGLRRYKTPEQQDAATQKQGNRIRFGNWILDRKKLQVFDSQNQPANLTVKEFRLLEALVGSPNIVLSREQLLDKTRGGDLNIFDRAVDIQITRIRKKLGDSASSPQIIKTVRGAGYLLSAETVILG